MTTNQLTLLQYDSGWITTNTNNEKILINNPTGTIPVEIYKLINRKAELSVDDMFAQLEMTDPRAAAATEVGTKWVANTFLSNHSGSLAILRMRAGLSQRELGKRLNVSQPQIAKWEKGDVLNMHLKTLKNLANALSVEFVDLINIIIKANKETKNEE